MSALVLAAFGQSVVPADFGCLFLAVSCCFGVVLTAFMVASAALFSDVFDYF